MSLSQELTAGLDAAVAEGLARGENNVVSLHGGRPTVEAGGSLEDHADFHRKAAAEYEIRKAKARKDGKAASAAFRAERKALREKHAADLAALDEREAVAKAAVAERMATAACLADVSRAAAKTIEAQL